MQVRLSKKNTAKVKRTAAKWGKLHSAAKVVNIMVDQYPDDGPEGFLAANKNYTHPKHK